LVICLPLTSETRQLLSTPEFSLLQQTSGRCFIVNVARGAIIDQAALIHALQQGHVSGAALDVTDPEPLPADDPLWNAPNCFITPHVSWLGAGYLDRCVDILLENLQRRAAGLEMLNVVKKG
jgi:phosphoglycerate dehydrogenase-like enzyme